MPQARDNQRAQRRQQRESNSQAEFEALMQAISPRGPSTPFEVPDVVQPEPFMEKVKRWAPAGIRGIGALFGVSPIPGAIAGAASEALAQGAENLTGVREGFSVPEIGGATAAGATGGKYVKAIAGHLASPLQAMLRAAPWAAASPVARDVIAEGELPDLSEVLTSGAVGAGAAGALGGLGKLLSRPSKAAATQPSFIIEPTAQAGGQVLEKGGAKMGTARAPRPITPSGPPAPASAVVAAEEVGGRVPIRERQPENYPGPRQEKIITAEQKAADKATQEAAAQTRIDDIRAGLVPRSVSASESFTAPIEGGVSRASIKYGPPKKGEPGTGGPPVEEADEAALLLDEATGTPGATVPTPTAQPDITPGPNPSFITKAAAGAAADVERAATDPLAKNLSSTHYDELMKTLGGTNGNPEPIRDAAVEGLNRRLAAEVPLVGGRRATDIPELDPRITSLEPQLAGIETDAAVVKAIDDPRSYLPEAPPDITTVPISQAGAASTIPISGVGRSRVDVAGQHYRALRELLGQGGEVGAQGPIPGDALKEGAGKVAGRALQREAQEAGLPIGRAAKAAPEAAQAPAAAPAAAPARQAAPPGYFEEMMSRIQGLSRRPGAPVGKGQVSPEWLAEFKQRGGQGGFVNPELMFGMGGAAVGSALSAASGNDPMAGAVAGFAAGLGGPAAVRWFTSNIPKIASDPSLHPTAQSVLQQITTPDGVKLGLTRILDTLPQAVRFNLLASETLPMNAFAGPWGAGIAKATELHMSGDPRGVELLKLMEPTSWARVYAESWDEAKTLIQEAERAGGPSYSEAGSPLGRLFATPGVVMTAGDLTTRKLMTMAGIAEQEARLATLTAEPELAYTKALANLQRSGPLAQLFQPFARTIANIAEQGGYRTPFLGSYLQSLRANPDPIKMQAAQQALGAGTLGASGAAGYFAPDDPWMKKLERSLVTNVAGPYSGLAAAGFAGGQAAALGKDPGDILFAAGREGIETLPLPAADIPLSYARTAKDFLNEPGELPSLPRGAVPGGAKSLYDLIVGEGGQAPKARKATTQRRKRERD